MEFGSGILYLIIGRVVNVFYYIAGIKFITNFLSPDEVGNYYLINAVVAWFGLVLVNPVGVYYNRELNTWWAEKKLGSGLRSLRRFLICSALISIPIVYIIKCIFNLGTTVTTTSLVIIVAANTYFASWLQNLAHTLNMLGKRKDFVFFTCISQVLSLVIAICLIFFCDRSASFWMVGILIGQFLAAVMVWQYFKNRIFISESIEKAKFYNWGLLSFATPIMFSTLFMWIQSQGYRVVVEKHLGAVSLASLGVGLGVASSVAALVESLTSQVLYPIFFLEIRNVNKQSRKDAWEKIWRRAIIVYLPAMSFFCVFSDLFLYLLTAPQYHFAGVVMKWGCVIELFRMLTNLVYLVAHSERETKKSIPAFAIGAFVTIVTTFYVCFINLKAFNLMPFFLASASFITFVFSCVFMKKLLPFELGMKFVLKITVYLIPIFLLSIVKMTAIVWAQVILFIIFGVYLLWVIWYHNQKNLGS